MRYLLATILFLLPAATTAQAPAIILPDPPAPTPVPLPPPAPGTPTPLPADQLYVVRSEQPLIVLTSPDGLLTVTPQAGPIVIRGKFVEAPEKTQTRLFKEKYVYIVEATATGRCELIVIPAGATEAKNVVRRLIDANVAPLPPPTPVPPGPNPPVPPTPTPAPIPAPGLHVLIVYETAETPKMPVAQQAILFNKSVRDYLNSACPLGPDGKTHEWRFYDKDVDTSAESALWQAAMKRDRKQVPWIVVSNGTTGFEGPLPTTVDEAMALFKKYAQ